MTDQNCKHTSLECVQERVSGADIKLAIIRCSHCGTAIGVLYPQIPDVVSKIGAKLDTIQESIKNLSR
jgi:predicted nucleotidyltransferase